MWRKRIQIGLVHVAISMMVVPADSTLNRIMINEMALSATMVALLLTLPYLFSPIQLAIGSFADRHPILGRRRSPYIFVGLVLSALGIALSPVAVFTFETSFWSGLLLSTLAFGIWGMGFNFSTVSYFALASELTDEKGRSQTISTMYVMMIISVIVTALLIGRAIEVYSATAVTNAIWWVTGVALTLGLVGLIGLENQTVQTVPSPAAAHAPGCKSYYRQPAGASFLWLHDSAAGRHSRAGRAAGTIWRRGIRPLCGPNNAADLHLWSSAF
jgi:MFS transporter, BCD family, chlorophyll transporter